MDDNQLADTNADWTNEISEGLMELAIMAVDHGIDSVRAGGKTGKPGTVTGFAEKISRSGNCPRFLCVERL